MPDRKRQFAEEVVRRLRDAGHEALWAGGCVRDLVLGLEPKDYDVATDARPEEVVALFGRRRSITVGASFGVVRVLGPRAAGAVEVATFRTEGPYSDGRHPDRVEFATAREDALRRDFTINGMFYDPVAGRVLDFVGGQEDLKRGVVRAIGDPVARFAEDKLRMLRAVRFAATFDFAFDPATQAALVQMAGQITVVSAERIAEELRRILTDPPVQKPGFAPKPGSSRVRGLELARETGLLRAILPEVAAMIGVFQGKPVQPEGDLWQHTMLVMEHLGASPGFTLAMGALLHDVGKPSTLRVVEGRLTFHNHERVGRDIAEQVCRRLRLSNRETERITWLVQYHMYLADAKRMRWAKLQRMLIADGIDELLALHRADALATDGNTEHVEYCERLLREPPEKLNPPALISGHDLVRLGIPEGPIYKEILDHVRDAQLEGAVRSKREALELAERRWKESPRDAG